MTTVTVIRPRAEDVEGQPILRPLPSRECRSVGPFVFFDHMLQTRYAPGSGMNIRQHPHIGLSTLTYLFEGELLHKDSLGSNQVVQAGDVSWMTAGSAIATSNAHPTRSRPRGSICMACKCGWPRPRHTSKGRGITAITLPPVCRSVTTSGW
jgi:redox-sensitive bicupin YhaK (pirin superfamily)